MLSSDGFAGWIGRHVPLLHVTSKVASQADPTLLRRKGGDAYPTIAFLDHEGLVLARTKGATSLDALGRLEGEARGVAAALDLLRARATAGGPDDKLAWFEERVERFAFVTAAEARAALAALKLPADVARRAEPRLVALEYEAALDTVDDNRDTWPAAGARFATMARAGRVPEGLERRRVFWRLLMAWAEQQGDVDAYGLGLERLETLLAKDPRWQGYLQRARARLQRMRMGG